jgi:uncharacterized protein YndB with AHSA1/START domain
MKPRTHVVDVEVPGTPEQVWEAIATGPGITAWFVPSEVDGREGGEVVSHLGTSGDMDSRGRITAYEPPSRFWYVERWDDVDFATEFLVEARGGGTCVVRIVSSGFGDKEGWDRQIEGLDRGWRAFLDNLRLYLERFAGAPCAQVVADAERPGEEPADALREVLDALGVPTTSAVGDEISTTAGAPAVAGRVERRTPYELALSTEDGLVVASSFAWNGAAMVRLQAYLYGEDAPAKSARLTPEWRSWLTGLAAHAGPRAS